MTKQPNEMIDRNEELYNDWKSGKMKMWELVAKYHLSATRIYFLVNRMEKSK
jgi:Mor family transcriptional regulator